MSTRISSPRGQGDRLGLAVHRAARTGSAQQKAARGTAILAVSLLTSAIFVTAVEAIFDTNRAVLLAVEYFIWAIAGTLLSLQLIRPLQGDLKPPSRKWLIAFLLALFVSTFMIWWDERRSDFAALILQTLALGFLAFPFFALDRAAKAVSISRVLMATCHVIFAACLISIVGEASGVLHFERGLGRFFGFLGDQAAWALTLPLLVYFSRGRFALAAVAILALALTASRAPALCVAAALLLLLIFSPGRRMQYAATLVPVAMIGILQSGIFTTLLGRIGTTRLSSSDRLETARLGLKIFHDLPIYGAGYNSFAYYYPRSVHSINIGRLPTQTSTLVQMLSDGGSLLFLPYLGFVIAVTFAALSVMKRSHALPDSGPINGAAAWLLAMRWVNQSAAWWVVGSFFGPLVLGVAGIVSGYQMKLENVLARRASLTAPGPTQPT